jgi:hypothetical protein
MKLEEILLRNRNILYNCQDTNKKCNNISKKKAATLNVNWHENFKICIAK